MSVSGEGANPGVVDLRRLAKDVGLDRGKSELILERVVENCRRLVPRGVSRVDAVTAAKGSFQ